MIAKLPRSSASLATAKAVRTRKSGQRALAGASRQSSPTDALRTHTIQERNACNVASKITFIRPRNNRASCHRHYRALEPRRAADRRAEPARRGSRADVAARRFDQTRRRRGDRPRDRLPHGVARQPGGAPGTRSRSTPTSTRRYGRSSKPVCGIRDASPQISCS